MSIYRITYKTHTGLFFYKEVEAPNAERAALSNVVNKNRIIGRIEKVAIEKLPETGKLLKLKKKRRKQ